MREVLTALSEHDVLVRPSGRPEPTADRAPSLNARTVEARLSMSARAAARLVQMIATGADDFVITSADGRVSVRARLAIDSVDLAEQRIPGSRVVVDWTRATIWNKGNRIRLSGTELRLLGGLLENNGHAVRRETLIERAWPRRELRGVETENALAVYICSLRKRLAAIGLADALETLRGIGYRLSL